VAATAAFVAACWISAAAAQTQPAPLPWEKRAREILEPKLPDNENPLDRQFQQNLKRLGLPPQPPLDTGADEAPAEPPPGLSTVIVPQMDSNHDGYVSRDEYFANRGRGRTAGSVGTQHYLQRQNRMDSRFRNADRNRDGRLSPEEIDEIGNARF